MIPKGALKDIRTGMVVYEPTMADHMNMRMIVYTYRYVQYDGVWELEFLVRCQGLVDGAWKDVNMSDNTIIIGIFYESELAIRDNFGNKDKVYLFDTLENAKAYYKVLEENRTYQ